MNRQKDVPELPKGQRFANRPELDKMFTEGILETNAGETGKEPRQWMTAGMLSVRSPMIVYELHVCEQNLNSKKEKVNNKDLTL